MKQSITTSVVPLRPITPKDLLKHKEPIPERFYEAINLTIIDTWKKSNFDICHGVTVEAERIITQYLYLVKSDEESEVWYRNRVSVNR